MGKFESMNRELIEAATQRAAWYKSHGQGMMTYMMMKEAAAQFIDMANGGDGSCVGNGEIREKYYTDRPNAFFQHVCNELGWDWRS